MVSVKLGFRNLLRNRWRSGLTLAAISVAVALMIWMIALCEGWIDEMVRGVTAVETGQLQIQTAAYIENSRVYETIRLDPGLLGRVAAVPGVSHATPRVKGYGLVGNEERSQVARVVGVDPAAESAATPIARGIVAGRWLSDGPAPAGQPREVVLGEGIAQQLKVRPGEELVVFLEAADGSLGNELLQVVGVVRTGNTEVDRLSAYMHLEDARFVMALEDEVHEMTLRTPELHETAALAEAVALAIGGTAGAPPDDAALPPDALVVRNWQEIVPTINQMILVFRNSYGILYILVYLVAAVGIVNTARMSALERRREFGVMLAIGMRPRRMFRTIVTETLVLGAVGALVGASFGLLVTLYHATVGLDLAASTDSGSFSFMGVAFSERIRFVIRPVNVITSVAAMLLVAVLSGLWPALRAARIDPAPTIAGRT